jgi:hypothetical protein
LRNLDIKGTRQIHNHSSKDEILRKTIKYALFGGKENQDTMKEFRTQPVLEKLSNYKHKWIQHAADWTDLNSRTLL